MVRLLYACCRYLNSRNMAGAFLDGVKANESGVVTLGMSGIRRRVTKADILGRIPPLGTIPRDLAALLDLRDPQDSSPSVQQQSSPRPSTSALQNGIIGQAIAESSRALVVRLNRGFRKSGEANY